MNENTCVVVQCWAGDAHQIAQLLIYWQHHQVPVYLMSPEDAPVQSAWPGVTAIAAGKRGWSGPHTIERQVEHFKIMQSLPYEWIFYTDADAICLSAEFPEYVYDGRFHSNELSTYDFWTKVHQYKDDEREGEREDQVREACKYLSRIDDGTLDIGKWHQRCPLVMQPPYFLNQDVLQRFVLTAEKVAPWVAGSSAAPTEDFPIPFIDWFYPALCRNGGIPHVGWGRDGISMPTWDRHWLGRAADVVRGGGGRWVHSVKTNDTASILSETWYQRQDELANSVSIPIEGLWF